VISNPNDVNAENAAFGCKPEARGNGSKGGKQAQANRRAREASIRELKESLEAKADTPEKRALLPIILGDYRTILEAEIQRPASGKRAPKKGRISRKRLTAAKSRFMAGMWRIGALPRVPKPSVKRYDRPQDAPSAGAWQAELRRRRFDFSVGRKP